MDKHGALMFALVFLTVCSSSVSGSPRKPDNLKANILDGEVTLLWDPPMDITSMDRYSVQMQIDINWTNVSNCIMIRTTLCNLTSLIHNYMAPYRVRVRTRTANGVSKWAITRFLPNESKLRPPSFTLFATSSSLTVTVDEKPVLRKVFPFGITYTLYLEEKGKDNETPTIAYLNYNRAGAEGRTHTFRSLHSGREYCVRLMVQGNTGTFKSNVSTQQCLPLPERQEYIIAVTSLPILGVLAILAVIMSALCCFVRFPEKSPAALKSPKTGWSPLTVEEGKMEVVTDKGWLFIMPKTHMENWVNKEQGRTPHDVVPETEYKAGRRPSMDSGVSVGSNGATKTSGSDLAKQEDSECASIEGSQGTESFSNAMEALHPQDSRTQASAAEVKTDNSGPDNQLYWSSSVRQDSGYPLEQTHLAVDQYRRQRSPVVRLNTCDGGNALKEIHEDPDRSLVDVVTGYRKGQLSCMRQMNQGPRPGPEEAGGGRDTELSEEELTFSTNYRRKTHIQMETVVSVDDSESPSNRLHAAFKEESPPLFLPFTFLPLARGDLDCATNTVSISLCDVELWSE